MRGWLAFLLLVSTGSLAEPPFKIIGPAAGADFRTVLTRCRRATHRRRPSCFSQLDHATSAGSPRVLFVRGFEGAVIDDNRISNSTFNNVTETEVVQHVGRLNFHNVTITPAKLTRGRNSVTAPTSTNAQPP